MFLCPFLHDKIKKKGVFIMLRRYELTDDEWNRIVDLLPPEIRGSRVVHAKITVLSLILNFLKK